MRHIFFVLAIGISQPAFAQDGAAAGIQSTIQNQITALQSDDFAQAFSYASPMIQGVFGSADNFGAMVQRGYPMVYRPSSLRMLGLREIDGRQWQRVMIIDGAGATHMLDYRMLQTGAGWLIDAVQLLPQSGVGA